jgi:hypothetical protein
MTLRTSKKLFCPLVVFLILSFCLPILSHSPACGTSQAEGVSAPEDREEESTTPFLEELGLAEDIYSVSSLTLIAALQKREGYTINTFVPPLSDKPPAV